MLFLSPSIGQHGRLPEGVIVRTPSPLGQPMPPTLPTHGLVEVPANLSTQPGSTEGSRMFLFPFKGYIHSYSDSFSHRTRLSFATARTCFFSPACTIDRLQ